MNLVIVFAVLLGLTASVCTQSVCTTPNGETGKCIPIRSCSIIFNSLRTQDVAIKRFLQQSHCGFQGRDPMVCCGSTIGHRAPYIQTASSANPARHRNVRLVPRKGQCGKQGLLNKIFGGNETDINEFPWMALMEYSMRGASVGLACGGVLISERYVLTAAHCVKGDIETVIGKLYSVRLGEYDQRTDTDCIVYRGEGDDDPDETVCADKPQNIPVEEVIAHQQYNPNDQNNMYDIALVRLSRNAELSGYVQPICLPLSGESTSVGHNLTVAGWGRTETGYSSPIKLKVDVPVVSETACSRVYAPLSKRITDTQLCAGGVQGSDSCNGDSGGPIMRTFSDRPDYYLEGVVSYGPTDCGTHGVPGVYTKVSHYVNWIMDNMRP